MQIDVLHINTERNWRGGEQQAFSLLQGLHNRGVACGLVCQPNTMLAEKSRAAGIPTFEIAMKGESDFSAALKIRKILQQHRVKLTHAQTGHAHTLAFWASLRLGIKRLVTRHVAFSIYRHDFLKISGLKYKYMADYYIAVSQSIKNVLIKDGLNAGVISVVYGAVDPTRFDSVTEADVFSLQQELGLADTDEVILQAAHLSKEKGQAVLLQAMPNIIRKYPHAKLVFAGGGDDAQLKALATELGIANHVIFAGFRHDIGAFYKLCKVFVMSSLSEGLGTAVLDAFAVAKPVVVSNAGGLPEIVANNVSGYVVAAGDVRDLTYAIIDTLDDYPKSLAMAANGHRELMEKFTTDKMVEGNLAVYHRLMQIWIMNDE